MAAAPQGRRVTDETLNLRKFGDCHLLGALAARCLAAAPQGRRALGRRVTDETLNLRKFGDCHLLGALAARCLAAAPQGRRLTDETLMRLLGLLKQARL